MYHFIFALKLLAPGRQTICQFITICVAVMKAWLNCISIVEQTVAKFKIITGVALRFPRGYIRFFLLIHDISNLSDQNNDLFVWAIAET